MSQDPGEFVPTGHRETHIRPSVDLVHSQVGPRAVIHKPLEIIAGVFAIRLTKFLESNVTHPFHVRSVGHPSLLGPDPGLCEDDGPSEIEVGRRGGQRSQHEPVVAGGDVVRDCAEPDQRRARSQDSKRFGR